jgi:ParB-like nuclease family protein
MAKQQKIKLSYIAADPDLQPRAGMMNLETIEDYASDMRRGVQFPPLVVFHDGKSPYWLADGFHRLGAARAIGSKTILCEVRHGGKREALLYSVGCNAAHGQRRSNDDKRLAVCKLLKDKNWGQWSDREIAKRCHVSHTFVDNLRTSLATDASDERTYKTKHGTKAKMKTGKIGKSRSPAKPKMLPGIKRDIEHGWTALLEIIEQVTILQKEYPQAAKPSKLFLAITGMYLPVHDLTTWQCG